MNIREQIEEIAEELNFAYRNVKRWDHDPDISKLCWILVVKARKQLLDLLERLEDDHR